jgi:hypothetical protein
MSLTSTLHGKLAVIFTPRSLDTRGDNPGTSFTGTQNQSFFCGEGSKVFLWLKSNRNFPSTPRSCQDIYYLHFPTKTPYGFFSLHRVICPACLSILDLITLITSGEEYRSVYRFRGTVTSSVWSPKSLFRTVFTIMYHTDMNVNGVLPDTAHKIQVFLCYQSVTTFSGHVCIYIYIYDINIHHTIITFRPLSKASLSLRPCSVKSIATQYILYRNIYSNRTTNTNSWALFY